jgi:pre-rRNA-processing protein TSR4
VLRSQLPQENEYYDLEGEKKDGLPNQFCVVCGTIAPKTCSKCLIPLYCCKEHQLLHWTKGDHRNNCGKGADSSWVTQRLFTEREIVSEPEPEKTLTVDQDLSHLNVGGDEPSPEDDEEETQVDVDSAFLKFEKRIARAPDQAIRYDRNGEVLWVSDLNKQEEIPPCTHCGSERCFEFQIMPQMLNFLNIDHRDSSAIDWGTLVVFTCSNDCDAAQNSFSREHLYRQHFNKAGMGDSIRRAHLEKVVKEHKEQ